MAKRRTTKKKSTPRKKPSRVPPSGPLETLGRRLDEMPEVRAAEDAVARARAELEKAARRFEQVRAEARKKAGQHSEAELDDLVDQTLSQVRKHPGLGVLCSFLIGLLVGRWFHR